jgi:hypothetical protein
MGGESFSRDIFAASHGVRIAHSGMCERRLYAVKKKCAKIPAQRRRQAEIDQKRANRVQVIRDDSDTRSGSSIVSQCTTRRSRRPLALFGARIGSPHRTRAMRRPLNAC